MFIITSTGLYFPLRPKYTINLPYEVLFELYPGVSGLQA